MEKKENVIVLDAIETRKLDGMHNVCAGACIASLGAALACIIVGLAMPVFLTKCTFWTCWVCMALEAGAAGFVQLAKWISQNTL